MSESVMERVSALLTEARNLGYNETGIAKAEEAVRVADEAKDDKAGFAARLGLVESSTFGGWPEKALVAFGWCAAKHAADAERFPAQRFFGTDLLWMYKWITLQIPHFAQISRAQITQALDDMSAIYETHGMSPRPIHMNRARAMWAMGDDPDEAYEIYRKFQWAPRDRYADCRACEVNFQVDVHARRKEYDAVLRVAAPILEGSMGCAEVPHVTYPHIFEAFIAKGQPEEAERIDAAGYELVRANRDFVSEIADHAHYRMDVGRIDDAREILERHIAWAVNNRIERRALDYYTALARLFGILDADTTSKVRGDEANAAELTTHYLAEATAIAKRFDARNGNSHVSERMASQLARSSA